ncbi:hypothetical protein [Cyanobacterium aponinum]|uniref:Uncharacterized protein n=1 Tax=Cyanobacterium aponinum (strain PCC 10605) TaxID=755178 RepID=K9Z486_CYAAP|nr:hypothetical protein [Cyanobacterium aponinum]AFZ53954.1 hypothetical protein Cyan10605_1853 [Cyanobacterium aponinum PCC 10605]PHV61849.1 hypothetical protein CSQ80_13435 [Cyanobacterium aponinum IPPAS B-1201]
MEITLNKANKLLNKFKSERKNLRAVFNRVRYYHEDEKVEAITSVEVSLANLTPRVADEIQRMINTYRNQLQECLDIEADFFKLKEAIFVNNQRTGISEKLSQIEFLTSKVGLYDDLINEKKRNKRVTLTVEDINYELLRENLSGQDGSGKLYIQVFDVDRLAQERQEAITQMNQAEDEIARINNNTTINIDFTLASRRLLGLD